jgi:cytochrome c-type biogenesis protein CcmF
MISCFWEGQEGSFLLWLFWNAVLGLLLMYTNRTWKAPVMLVFCLVQVFLASMILGVVIGSLKIGSSPFILMREAMANAPVFQSNPLYVPSDGTGLNPLLQNYWMVIHPPTLFLGFATTLVPFAFALSGLLQRRFKEWIRPALPWALFSAAVLGLGILMGGYWAYETLNFGGYWNWDPVENAVYVPWLVLVASIHTMISYRKSETALKAALILVISVFILILYSTFLTRSGILGNASVHSFTDLGLSGQLLIYLLAFTIFSIALLSIRWKELPSSKEEVSTYSREFWIFIGATVLCLAGFQVLAATSIPVYNSVLNVFGIDSNIAPPADQVAFYTRFQLWFAVSIALLSAVGQYFWWKKIDKQSLFTALSTPFVVTMIASAAVIVLGKVGTISYIVLLTAAIFTIVSNGFILAGIWRSSPKLSGGAIAHIGIGLVLLGILFSSGYSKVVSLNQSGMVYHKQFSEEMNRENILLWYNKPVNMGVYEVVYKGRAMEAAGFPAMVSMEDVRSTEDPAIMVAKRDIRYKDKIYFAVGDTLRTDPVNTFYEVFYSSESGKQFTLYPRAQINPSMGLISSPDIKRSIGHDLYTHVSSIPDPSDEKEWKPKETQALSIGDTFYLNDYVAVFSGVSRVNAVEGLDLEESDVAVKAIIELYDRTNTFILEPMLVVDQGRIGRFADEHLPTGVRIFLEEINPSNGSFTFATQETQKDYIILKAMEKPAINVLWIGTLVLMLGFGIAVYRRYGEFKLMRDKGQE